MDWNILNDGKHTWDARFDIDWVGCFCNLTPLALFFCSWTSNTYDYVDEVTRSPICMSNLLLINLQSTPTFKFFVCTDVTYPPCYSPRELFSVCPSALLYKHVIYIIHINNNNCKIREQNAPLKKIFKTISSIDFCPFFC